jgi:hypothetical protein
LLDKEAGKPLEDHYLIPTTKEQEREFRRAELAAETILCLLSKKNTKQNAHPSSHHCLTSLSSVRHPHIYSLIPNLTPPSNPANYLGSCQRTLAHQQRDNELASIP